MPSATIIGSGPNGLASAIALQQRGVQATVLERNSTAGGACSSGEVTLPCFVHDLGSSAFPMGAASPFFNSLPFKIPWVEGSAACAHPLDDGTAVLLEHAVTDCAEGLDRADRAAYRALMQPLAESFPRMVDDLLGPVVHVPRHPLLLAGFGRSAALPAAALARLKFQGTRARALLAGMAAHAVMPLEAPVTSAVALILMMAGHNVGWPVVRGGAGRLTELLAGYLESLGGQVKTGHDVTELPPCDGRETLVLADVTPRQLLRIAGGALRAEYRRQLENYRYGAGSFKVDYALSEPIPWSARDCGRAATVHVGGSLEEIAASERSFNSAKPFVLVVQPSVVDSSRAPAGKHTAWAYCHVPQGSVADHLPAIEAQLERFAPGFQDCVLARAVSPPALLERWNPNLVGGDLSGGRMDPWQLVFRPTGSLYRTSRAGLFLCSSSTPPGGGVHGMAGWHAAQAALRQVSL